MSNWTPPSVKKLDKLPHIQIEGDNHVDMYLNWLDVNSDLPRTVPPIWTDFVITFSRTFPPDNRRHEYIEIVHYDDDLCGLSIAHLLDGKKILTVVSRYADYVGPMVKGSVYYPQNSRFKPDWLQNEGRSVIVTVLAVQLYLLSTKPEVVPKILPAPKRRANADIAQRRNTTVREKSYKAQRVKYIYLTKDDPPPKRVVNYRQISWMVRGHYRNQPIKGGTKLIYIAPHRAARGEKKAGAMRLKLKAEED